MWGLSMKKKERIRELEKELEQQKEIVGAQNLLVGQQEETIASLTKINVAMDKKERLQKEKYDSFGEWLQRFAETLNQLQQVVEEIPTAKDKKEQEKERKEKEHKEEEFAEEEFAEEEYQKEEN